MNDPILDEIQRVRQELIQKHGGPDGYFKYVQKLDATHRRKRRRKAKKTGGKGVKTVK